MLISDDEGDALSVSSEKENIEDADKVFDELLRALELIDLVPRFEELDKSVVEASNKVETGTNEAAEHTFAPRLQLFKGKHYVYSWEKRKTVPIQLPAGKSPNNSDTRVQFHSDAVPLLVSHESQLAIYDASKMDRIYQWVPQDSISAPISYAAYSCNCLLVFASFTDGNLGIFDADTLRLRCCIAPSAYLSQPVLNGIPEHIMQSPLAQVHFPYSKEEEERNRVAELKNNLEGYRYSTKGKAMRLIIITSGEATQKWSNDAGCLRGLLMDYLDGDLEMHNWPISVLFTGSSHPCWGIF